MLPLLLLPAAGAVAALVHQRRRARTRVDGLERRLHAVLQAAGDAYIAVGPDGSITEWNEVAERTFGWTADEVLGRRLEGVIMPPEYAEVHPGKMREHRPGGTGFMVGRRAHVPALHRDGRRLPVEVRAWASPDGRGWSAFVRDITDRVQSQAELEAARDAALAASRLKSEFLANMSHEIRTPMNGVIGMSTLLLASDLDAEQRAHAETVRSSADALLTVIDDVLDFSKIEAGKLDVETIDLDLRTVVEESAALLSARAEEKGLELTCLVDPDVPALLRGDPGRLRQVLLNLVGNAVKFTASGEVAVRARVLAQDADVAMVELSVRDTGIGVDPDVVETLFEAFAQADASTTRRYGGSGLGLAISRQLVGLMGGELTAGGERGVGSVFRVRLTLERGSAPATGDEVDLRGVRVLVVDDAPSAARVLDRLLTGWGCTTTVVGEAPRALAAATAAARAGEPFDVALVDLHMPEVDGLALTRALAADPQLAFTRTVLVGSALHPGDPDRARAAGAVDVLAKPVRSSPLQQVLAAALGRGPAHPAPVANGLAGDERSERVLLVEDNPVNQQVGRLTLERLGCAVDVVGDGQAALDVLAVQDYDVVLMDCQMPVLDGFDATRELRRREASGARGRRTPVVALTASAMAADREACLAAGMDDHLSKPVRASDLVAVLDRWALRPAAGAAASVVAVPEPRSAADDLPVLDETVTGPLRALGPGVLGQIATTYLDDVPVRLQALRDAAHTGDADAARRAAHALKGASAGIGARRVGAVAAAVEQAARDGELPPGERVQELSRLVDEVAGALAAG